MEAEDMAPAMRYVLFSLTEQRHGGAESTCASVVHSRYNYQLASDLSALHIEVDTCILYLTVFTHDRNVTNMISATDLNPTRNSKKSQESIKTCTERNQ
jgi:hypothetical protein